MITANSKTQLKTTSNLQCKLRVAVPNVNYELSVTGSNSHHDLLVTSSSLPENTGQTRYDIVIKADTEVKNNLSE